MRLPANRPQSSERLDRRTFLACSAAAAGAVAWGAGAVAQAADAAPFRPAGVELWL